MYQDTSNIPSLTKDLQIESISPISSGAVGHLSLEQNWLQSLVPCEIQLW